jgi:hypothetical protein
MKIKMKYEAEDTDTKTMDSFSSKLKDSDVRKGGQIHP